MASTSSSKGRKQEEEDWAKVKKDIQKIQAVLDEEGYHCGTQMETVKQLRVLAPQTSGLPYLSIQLALDNSHWDTFTEDMRDFRNLIRKDLNKERLTYDDCVGWSLELPILGDLNGEDSMKVMKHFRRISLREISQEDKESFAEIAKDVSGFPKESMTIAYCSSLYKNHPLTHLMKDLPKSHDGDRFSVICYDHKTEEKALTPEDEAIRDAISSQFKDLPQEWSDGKKADLIRSDGVQIFADLNGALGGNVISCLQYKPAPITMTMLGYPGSTGTTLIDYFLADERVVPQNRTNWMVEKIAYLPKCCYIGSHQTLYPNVNYSVRLYDAQKRLVVVSGKYPIPNTATSDSAISAAYTMVHEGKMNCIVKGQKLINGAYAKEGLGVDPNITDPIVTSYAKYGLPEGKIILGISNAVFKISPDYFKACVKILRNVPKSILWICGVNTKNQIEFKKNLLKVAGSTPKPRIFFANYAQKEEHIRRGLLIDLLLDPWICNGHTTSLDGFWSGIPILTLVGQSFHTRVTASMLHVLQLPVLITTTPEEYVERAILLANNPKGLTHLRNEINKRKMVGPLFDVRLFASDLEELFQRMWERRVNGQDPDHLLPLPGSEEWMNPEDSITLETLKNMQSSSGTARTWSQRGSPEREDEPEADADDDDVPRPRNFDDDGDMGGVPRRIKRPRTFPLPLHRVIGGVPNNVETPTPSTETLTTVSLLAANMATIDVNYRPGGGGTSKFPSANDIFRRLPIRFSPPPNQDLRSCGPQDPRSRHGQRAVTITYFEIACNNVLHTMTLPENMPNLHMGPVQANQFLQLLQEYFYDDGLPAIPLNRQECPNFWRDPRGILFSTDRQYGYVHSFFPRVGWESMEPAFGFTDMYSMKKHGERAQTHQLCRLCPETDPVNTKNAPNGPQCATLAEPHFKSTHAGAWYKKVSCTKCGKDLTALKDCTRTAHENNHTATLDAGEAYYADGENEANQEEFIVNLHESYPAAIARYKSEARNSIRKFRKVQRMATFTTWLVKEVHMVLAFLKKNPSMISATAFIGYEFKALLQCHLVTVPPPRVPNLTPMVLNLRQQYAKRFFKFYTQEAMCMLMRAFKTKDEMNELEWQDQRDEINKPEGAAGRNFDPHCKLCANPRVGASDRFKGIVKADHMYPPVLERNQVCPYCGFYFHSEINNNETRNAHVTAHENIPMKMWKEQLLKPNATTGTLEEMEEMIIRLDIHDDGGVQNDDAGDENDDED